MAIIDESPHGLIKKLRSWFFAKDRDITLQSGRELTLGNGKVVDDAIAAQFVTMANTGNLANERQLTAGDGLDLTDGGAGGNATLAVDVTDIIDTAAGLTESSNNIQVNLGVGSTFNAGAIDVTATTLGGSPTNNYVLKADDGEATGMVWSASTSGEVPIGGIIMWSGASAPLGWALCDGSNGTPDLRDRFIVAAGPTYVAGSSGGAATVDIQHGHADGTLATDSDNHSHGDGSYAAASDSHSHGDGSLAAASDSHSHGDGSLAAASDGHSHGDTFSLGASDSNQQTEVVGAPTVNLARSGHGHAVNGSVSSDSHSHGVTGSTASDSHSHGVTGTSASDSHSHDVTGTSASDSHSHDVTGSTANALSTTQEILPPYYSLAFIMRIS